MPWSWSHTNEAYEYAFGQLKKFSRRELVEILVEWWMHDHHSGNDSAWTTSRLAFAKKCVQGKFRLKHDYELRSEIWIRADDQRKCDKGGFNAWMCPYGCGCHSVDFGPDDEEDFENWAPFSVGFKDHALRAA